MRLRSFETRTRHSAHYVCLRRSHARIGAATKGTRRKLFGLLLIRTWLQGPFIILKKFKKSSFLRKLFCEGIHTLSKTSRASQNLNFSLTIKLRGSIRIRQKFGFCPNGLTPPPHHTLGQSLIFTDFLSLGVLAFFIACCMALVNFD